MEIYGLCSQAMIPVRNSPAHAGELVTQLLFGELITCLEMKENWCRIKGEFDHYEGWVNKQNIQIIPSEEFQKLKQSHTQVFCEPIGRIQLLDSSETFYIPGGSTLYLQEENSKYFKMGEMTFYFIQNSEPHESGKAKSIPQLAKQFLNTPYLWGGRTLMGIDCSGFSQLIYKMYGLSILRDASQQVNTGETINFLSASKPGDLAFFDNEEGRIVHVGILLSDAEIIHASGRVKIDRIDQHGIFNLKIQQYTHRLRIIKRLIL